MSHKYPCKDCLIVSTCSKDCVKIIIFGIYQHDKYFITTCRNICPKCGDVLNNISKPYTKIYSCKTCSYKREIHGCSICRVHNCPIRTEKKVF